MKKITLSNDITALSAGTDVPGASGKLLVIQDETGGHTITLAENNFGNVAVSPDPGSVSLLEYNIDETGTFWTLYQLLPITIYTPTILYNLLDRTTAGAALDARQGKALKDLINGIIDAAEALNTTVTTLGTTVTGMGTTLTTLGEIITDLDGDVTALSGNVTTLTAGLAQKLDITLGNSEIRVSQGDIQGAEDFTTALRASNINFGHKSNSFPVSNGYANYMFGGDVSQPNIMDGRTNLRMIVGYDNRIEASIASFILSMHSIIRATANHALIIGGSLNEITDGAKTSIVGCQNAKLSGQIGGIYSILNAIVTGNYSLGIGGTDLVITGTYTSSLGGRAKNYLQSDYGGGIGGQNINFSPFNTDPTPIQFSSMYSVHLGGLDLKAAVTRTAQYGIVWGRGCILNGDYSAVGGRESEVNSSNGFAFGYKAIANHTGANVIVDGSGTGLTSGQTNKLYRFFTNGYALMGGNVGIGLLTATAKLHLPAQTATAGSAGLKVTPGAALMTVPEPGAIEASGSDIYFTGNDGVRQKLNAQNETSALLEYPETAYAQTITWTGTTAPTGMTAVWQATKIGKQVTLRFNAKFSGAGVSLTEAIIPLPTGLPIPAVITGFDSTNDYICMGVGALQATSGTFPAVGRTAMRRPFASTYEIHVQNSTAIACGAFNFTITYWV